MAQYDVDLREYWRIIRKRKVVIILVAALVALGSYGFSKIKEPAPKYRASAAVKIEQQSDMAFIRSGGFWIQSESMDTHAYTLTSYPVLKATAIKMGWLSADLAGQDIRRDRKSLAVIDRLKNMIATDVNQKTNIINIQVTSGDEEEAARVANALADAYREFVIMEKNQRTFDVKKFIEDQLSVLAQRLTDAQKALREFQEENSMTSVNERTREVKTRLLDANREYADVNNQKQVLISQLQQIENRQAGDRAETIAKQMTYAKNDSPLFSLGGKLDQLLSKRQSLLASYTEKHPNVMEVDNQINRIVIDAEDDLRMYLDAVSDRGSNLELQMARLEEELRRLPDKEHRLARLEMDVKLQERLYSELQGKHQEVLIQESGKMDFVTLVKPAIAPQFPYNIPSKMMISFTGIILGLILGLVFAFGVEMFDTSMGTIEDVEASLQVPVLGVIPHLGGDDAKKKTVQGSEIERARDLVVHYDPKSLAAEAFRSLRTNLQFVRMEKKNKILLVTSAFVKEGKTINAVNLALSLAQTGERVLLIDADLRRSMIHKIFGLSRSPGLADYVLGDYPWREVVSTITDMMLGDFEIEDILKNPGLDKLHMITAGTKPPNPTEILNSPRFRELLQEASHEYSYILIDAPPVLPVADPCEIAPYTDGVILVYTVGRISRGILKRAKATLDNINANIVGVILNNVKPEVGPDYFKYHTYYYYGPDHQPAKKKADGRKTPADVC